MSTPHRTAGRGGDNFNIAVLVEMLSNTADPCIRGAKVDGDEPRPRDPGSREGEGSNELPMHLTKITRVKQEGSKRDKVRRSVG